jgi:pantoate kinase
MQEIFVPGHITGFFAAQDDNDPKRKGSIGCGITLGIGGTTSVSPAEETTMLLNGEPSDAPISRYVVDELARMPVRVATELSVPVGSGFGASGIGALGCAYGLNSLFDLGLTANQLGAVAHVAEVKGGGGLGDVIAQNTGGLVIRLRGGAPGIGRVDRVPVPSLRVDYVVRGPLSTKEVLSDPGVMAKCNRAGKSALKALLSRPNIKNFMHLSSTFAKETNLASDWALDAIEAVKSTGGLASMIMLGDAVFAIPGADKRTDSSSYVGALSEFGEVKSTFISQGGVVID